ncbi:iron ABC transporter permease [Microlunatus parietis]
MRDSGVGARAGGRPVRLGLVLVGLAVGTLAVVAIAAAVGTVNIPVPAVLRFLFTGDAGDPVWTTLLDRVRLPRVGTAATAGAGLAVAGLVMQTLFANPLADPYVLGISSGASLGVALVTLGGGSVGAGFVAITGAGRAGVVVAAAAGALAVLLVILLFGRWISSVITLLIIGVMVSSAVGAITSLLLAFAEPARLQQFISWGLGSFSGVPRGDLVLLMIIVGVAAVILFGLSQSLNAMLLGERYAVTMGVRVRLIRYTAITATAIIAGAVTAYCGPIAFLGIAVPHLARLLIGTSDHRILLPATLLLGVVIAVGCSMITQLPPGDLVLPVNVVSALVGVPVVLVVLVRSRRLAAGAV